MKGSRVYKIIPNGYHKFDIDKHGKNIKIHISETGFIQEWFFFMRSFHLEKYLILAQA